MDVFNSILNSIHSHYMVKNMLNKCKYALLTSHFFLIFTQQLQCSLERKENYRVWGKESTIKDFLTKKYYISSQVKFKQDQLIS